MIPTRIQTHRRLWTGVCASGAPSRRSDSLGGGALTGVPVGSTRMAFSAGAALASARSAPAGLGEPPDAAGSGSRLAGCAVSSRTASVSAWSAVIHQSLHTVFVERTEEKFRYSAAPGPANRIIRAAGRRSSAGVRRVEQGVPFHRGSRANRAPRSGQERADALRVIDSAGGLGRSRFDGSPLRSARAGRLSRLAIVCRPCAPRLARETGRSGPRVRGGTRPASGSAFLLQAPRHAPSCAHSEALAGGRSAGRSVRGSGRDGEG